MGKKLGIYLLLVLGIVLAVSLVRNILKINEVKKRADKIKSRVEKLQQENKQFQVQVKETNSQEYVEKQLRDKLGMVKEGETIVVLPDIEIVKKLVPQIPEEEETLPDPIWRKWLRLLGI